jgi:hypothetical protein
VNVAVPIDVLVARSKTIRYENIVAVSPETAIS